MTYYQSGYDYFDLHLSSIMQQKSSIVRETFMLGIELIEFRRLLAGQIGRELEHYILHRPTVRRAKIDIECIKEKLTQPVKYVVKRKIKNMIGDGAICVAVICAGIKERERKKKLNRLLEKRQEILNQCMFPKSKWRPNFGKRFQSFLIREDVLNSNINYLNSAHDERLSLLKSNATLHNGECVVCGEKGEVVKIKCGDYYHIECVNDLIVADVITNKLNKATCIKCEETL